MYAVDDFRYILLVVKIREFKNEALLRKHGQVFR